MKLSKLTLAALGLTVLTVLAPVKDVSAAPAAPSDAAQNASTDNGFRVGWSAVSGATNYVATVVKDGKVIVGETSTGGKNEFTYKDDSRKILAAGTDYSVRIQAVDASGAKSAAADVKVATAPAVMASFEQTDATNTSIKLSWTASPGATGYIVKMGKDAASAKDLNPTKPATNTNINLTGLKADSAYYVAVYPVRKVTDKFFASDKCAFKTKAFTTAEKVTNVKVTDWNVKANFLRLTWKNTAKYEAGYQVRFYNAAGKSLKTYLVRGRNAKSYTAINKKLKNKAMSVKVRTYNTLNGKKVYGPWSDALYLVPQANVTAKKVNATSVELSWNKISGAKKYKIMMATSDGGNYSSAGTTTKTSYTVSGLKEGQDYYFYVRALNAKMGGKNHSSNKLDVPNDVNVQVYTSSNNVVME